MFCIEFVDFLGEIRNDTDINGKSFIFKIIDIDNELTFDCILFIHQSVNPFLTLENDNYIKYNSILLDLILKQYSIKDLLEYKENENS